MGYKIKNANKRSLPSDFDKTLDNLLEPLGLNLRKKISLAENIKELSRIYTTDHDQRDEIWKSKAHQAAYLSYFLPLNFARLQTVIDEAKSLGFFDDIKNVYDVGSGPGTVEWVFSELDLLKDLNFINIEKSPQAVDLHKQLFHQRRIRAPKHIDGVSTIPPKSVGIYS